MVQNISVPDIGDFDSVEIIEILVKVGDLINKDDPIVTLESDKSSVEVPSPIAGKVSELNIKIGDKVSKGSLLAKLESGSPSVEVQKEIYKDELKVEEKINPKKIQIQKNSKKIFIQPSTGEDIDPVETKEWIESLNAIIENDGPSRASYLLNKVVSQAYTAGLVLPDTRTTPYINTIPTELEVKSPGNQNIEKKFVLM